MVPIVRACASPKYDRVVAVLASQMGKTDNLLSVAGQKLDQDPAPILFVGPTRSNVEKVIEPRFNKMVRSCESLWRKLAKGKSSSKTYKNIAGVSFRLAWAGSATELASEPAAIVMVDERDRMEADVGGEGDPLQVAEARKATYPDGKTIVTSTPTIGSVNEERNEKTGITHWGLADPADVQSPIWKLWQEGTRFEWAWPCSECRSYFIPRFSLLQWPEGATPQQALREAKLACPHCGSLIGEEKKTVLNARGVFIAPGQSVSEDGIIQGPEPETTVATFWVSGLCSPWRTFGQRAKAFLEATRSKDAERIQAVINTEFGELYKVSGEAPDWKAVANLRQPYTQGSVPDAVEKIICTVDVQKDRLIYVIRGWGYRLESWLLRHEEIWGETEHDSVWLDLDQVLDAGIGDRRIDLMLIDSGYRPGDRFKRPDNQIYAFARKHRGRVRAIKGHASLDKPYKASMIDVTLKGKVYKQGLQLWHLDTDHWKAWVHARIEWPAGEPGAWHLAQDSTDDYCQQLTAEARVVKPSGQVIWIRQRKDNHFFDCEMMQAAGAHMLGVHLMQPKQAVPEQPKAKPVSAPQRGGFVNAWKDRI